MKKWNLTDEWFVGTVSVQHFSPIYLPSSSFQKLCPSSIHILAYIKKKHIEWEANARKICENVVLNILRLFFFFWKKDELTLCYKCASFPQIVKLAVYGMLPKNLHRRTMMQRLHIFPDDVSPGCYLSELTGLQTLRKQLSLLGLSWRSRNVFRYCAVFLLISVKCEATFIWFSMSGIWHFWCSTCIVSTLYVEVEAGLTS